MITPKYVTDNNKAAKMFREDYYATADMLALGLTILLEDGLKPEEITTKKLKKKMHELLYENGMSIFKREKATAQGTKLCKELHPEFFDEMVILEEEPAAKAPAKKQEAAKKPAAKSTTKPATKNDKKAPAEQPARKSAVSPEFAAATA